MYETIKLEQKLVKKMYATILIMVILITTISLDAFEQYAREIEQRHMKSSVIKELVNERTRNTNTYLLSDGSKRTDIYQEDIRFEEEGELKEYDSSLITLSSKEKRKMKNILNSGSYAAVNASGDSKQYFPEKLDNGEPIIMSKGKYQFSFIPRVENRQYNSRIDKNYIVYKSKDAISEYQYISKENGVKENIILSSKPSSNSFSFDVFMKNMEIKIDKKSGGIDFIDTVNKKKVGYIMPPNITDAHGEMNYKDIFLKIIKKDKRTILKLIINQKYLERVSYPIVVDPTAVWFSNKLSTAIVSNLSFVKDQCWTSDPLVVKNKCDKRVPYAGTEQRVYLDIGAIISGDAYIDGPVNWKDKKINRVILSVAESVTEYALGTVQVKETFGKWSLESLSWNNQPQVGKVLGSFKSTGLDRVRHEIDLTEPVKEMIDTGNFNKGLVFTAEEGTGVGFGGPEIGPRNMFISVIYDMESISITEYDYSTRNEYIYNYLYDESLNNVFEEPYIPTHLAGGDEVSSPFTVYPGDSLDDADETMFPYSAIVRIASEVDRNGDGIKEDYRGFGSGYIIGPNIVVTAGHCVWSGNPSWVEDMKLLTQVNHFNFNQSFDVKKIICPTKYIQNGSSEYDWAIIIVDGNIGQKNGWLGFGVSNDLIDKSITVSGYTGSYGHKYGKLYKKEGSIVDVTEKKFFITQVL